MTEIGLIGPGKVGRALAERLPAELFSLGPVLSGTQTSARRAVRLIGAGAPTTDPDKFRSSKAVLIAVPDTALEAVAQRLARVSFSWRKKVVLHTSGTMSSKVLEPLRVRGAAVGSMHPFYVFQRPVLSFEGVLFTVEGSSRATNLARRIVRAYEGEFELIKAHKKVHHSIAATILSDFLTGLLEAAIQQMVAGGFTRRRALDAANVMLQAVWKDYERSGRKSRPGPLLRGEQETVSRHLTALDDFDPALREAYRRAAQAALAILRRDREAFTQLDPD